jgi:prepilin-type N-terminal cleavage/methylation domain-containing protein
MIKKTKKGFTLVELLVVISIISLLSSIVLSSLSTARLKARNSVKVQTREEVKKALALFYADKGYYPESAGALIPNYISAVNPDMVKYYGLPKNCSGESCTDYHININLESQNSSASGDYIASGDSESRYGSPNGGYINAGKWIDEYTTYYTSNNGKISWDLFYNGIYWIIAPSLESRNGPITAIWVNWTPGEMLGDYTPYYGAGASGTSYSGTVTISNP